MNKFGRFLTLCCSLTLAISGGVTLGLNNSLKEAIFGFVALSIGVAYSSFIILYWEDYSEKITY